MENLLGITGGALYHHYPPTSGLLHAGLIPEPGYLSDDEDLSQLCGTDEEPGSGIMLGEDWMSWNIRQEVHIANLRIAWLAHQQAARDDMARGYAYRKHA